MEVLRFALLPVTDKIDLAFVYGSQARGKTRAASDIDLLIVGTLDELELHWSISQAEEQLNRPVNYTLKLPFVFAENGGVMLAGILNCQRSDLG